jgi:SAM-dependent methyltransferase
MSIAPTPSANTAGPGAEPWQLQMFQRSLKKRQKVQALLDLIGDVRGQRCLLITCGDNTGALNWYFRAHGGSWTWADAEQQDASLTEMSQLLGEPVLPLSAGRFPIREQQFDCVVAIDVLEHLEEDQTFLRELRSVIRPGGRAIVTVPNGDPALLANQLRWRIGMRPEIYGHTRAGYTADELRESLRAAGFLPLRDSAYSRFFTELVELAINFGYMFVLTAKRGTTEHGKIAPTSSGELETHGAAYRIYSWIYPALRAVTLLDHLLPPQRGGAVLVEAVPLAGERVGVQA